MRLRAHIECFLEILDAGGELGKRLDFLLQELNREGNTMLSKTTGGDPGIGLRLTALGLEMKTEIERAREQVQNLEWSSGQRLQDYCCLGAVKATLRTNE